VSTTFRADRAECPKCGTLKPRVTLLTSYVVFLQCVKCEHAWEIRPSDYPATDRERDVVSD
jgi:hypothetical protein